MRCVDNSTGGGTAMTSSFNSNPIHISDYDAYSVKVKWIGADASDGSIKLQATNDQFPNLNDWCDIKGTQHIIASGSGHKFYEDKGLLGFEYIRVVFDVGSNTTGLLSIQTTRKNDRP